MSDATDLSKGASSNGGAGDGGSATVTLPPWVEGQLGKERVESLRKEVESDPEFLKEISAKKGLPEVFDAWRAQRSSLKGTLRIPKKEDGKEVWDQFFKATGRPESPKDYAFDKPKLPEGMVYDEKLEESFRTWAHEEGLSTAAAKNLFSKFNAAQIERFQGMSDAAKKKAAEMESTRAKEIEAVRTELRSHWKDTYDARMPRNMAALKNPVMIPADVAAAFDKAGILRNPAFHLWWDKQVSMMSNDRKLGLKGEEGEAVEEEESATVPDREGKRHLKAGFFKDTAKRYPTRKKGE